MKLLTTIALVALACGGSKSATKDDDNIGQTHIDTKGADTAAPAADAGVDAAGQDAGEMVAEAGPDAAPAESAAPVTIEIVNVHDQDLTFSLNKGWQTSVNAIAADKKSFFLMFPKHCTAVCDAADEERCPFCPEHETTRDERAAQRRQVVAPGETFELAWNGRAYAYEKAKGTREGRNVRCSCYREENPPAGEFEITVCGKRETTAVGVRSKLQCVKTPITLPLGAEPVRVRAEFPPPPPPPKPKKRRGR